MSSLIGEALGKGLFVLVMRTEYGPLFVDCFEDEEFAQAVYEECRDGKVYFIIRPGESV